MLKWRLYKLETIVHFDGVGKSLDVTEPQSVEILIRHDGKTVWINVNGTCLLRACRIKRLVLNDERDHYSIISRDT